ncbi:GlxA family transcriptional regulator [Mesorhizobium sp.]|uniref:GlxA family transcriptional regulator n=1 Tax=Mesorhizobium sp. TaxID=1871066 RepID=UPI000FE86072|nr:GlxA family transcriptional regulator [Mesorhizobium sp.]RWI85996.1 MAG: GlxA family transcriptional regulator [Mesorhizobium sp.]
MTTIESKALQRMGFLLVPNFALMSYASATEPLRAANLIAGVPLYDVTPLSSSGQPVRSSSGLTIDCDDLLEKGGACHTVFVCAGGTRQDWVDRDGLYGMLRKLSRQGVRIGGISSGAFLLAAAGLMNNRDFTIHWEHAELLKEAFPYLSPRQARYVIDGDRITCAGGIAPLDMMHAMISERMGSHFARRVSDWYLHTSVGEPTALQRGSAAERFGTHHPALLTVLERMEATIEQPLSRDAMAKVAGVSVRHLDRLFADHLEIGFLEAYRNVRLDHARRLLEQSPLSISQIAFATGFSNAGHFSKAFSVRFTSTPSRLRDKIRESKR